MSELDKRIEEALHNEDADLLNALREEPSLFELLTDAFRGRYRWLNVLAAVWMLVFLVLSVVAAVKFFQAETQREMIMWAAGCLIGLMVVSLLKTWYWMELHKNALMREIKRLELQVARLSGRIRE